MKAIWTTSLLAAFFASTNANAADVYPRSTALVAAQAELDELRAKGPRDQMDAVSQQRLGAAMKQRDLELDSRNAEWKERDSTSMLKAQAKVCDTVRQGLSEGKKATGYFEELRYAGFSSDETLDIVLQIDRHAPQVGKNVRVAFCILGLPTDTVRSESKNSKRVMFVYPSMFVHAEDGVVTSWSDR